ncbi:MAG: N-acetylmuramoyl-L-alanine amidase [Prevotellaceae bacterium]|nr:N-acetylmuramoyl-L-alanine amidase [Prevotellaceae bacterium]
MKRKFLTTVFFAVFLLSTFAQNDTLVVFNHKVNFGMRIAANREIDAIVIHSSYYNLGGDPYSFSNVLSLYRSYFVNAHYIIARNGRVYNLVDECNIAFHAGRSVFPDGSRSGGNDRSIGIEMISSETDSPTQAQMHSLVRLVQNIKQHYNIKFVLRHSDIAPDRKTDPWNFDWLLFLQNLQNQTRQVVVIRK